MPLKLPVTARQATLKQREKREAQKRISSEAKIAAVALAHARRAGIVYRREGKRT
jgi:hypothetical protein